MDEIKFPSRLWRIHDCMLMINSSIESVKTSPDPLYALLGELDYLSELHRLLYEWDFEKDEPTNYEYL